MNLRKIFQVIVLIIVFQTLGKFQNNFYYFILKSCLEIFIQLVKSSRKLSLICCNFVVF